MKTEEEIFAMMAIAKEQQQTIDTAIVKMTTMAEEITEENQKLFNKNMERQVKAHNAMMTNTQNILAKRVWTSHMVFTLIGCICVCAAVLAATWGYEQYLMNGAIDLSMKEQRMEMNIQNLKRHHGDVTLSNCGGQTCVLINPDSPMYGSRSKPYYIVG